MGRGEDRADIDSDRDWITAIYSAKLSRHRFREGLNNGDVGSEEGRADIASERHWITAMQAADDRLVELRGVELKHATGEGDLSWEELSWSTLQVKVSWVEARCRWGRRVELTHAMRKVGQMVLSSWSTQLTKVTDSLSLCIVFNYAGERGSLV